MSGRRALPKQALTPKYCGLLLVACLTGYLSVNAFLIQAGNSFLWNPDALDVQFHGLVQIGRLLRGSIQQLMSGAGLSFDEYLFTVGYGADVNSICQLNDPLQWLAVFVPARYTEYLFYALCFLRVFLAACTFSAYTLYRGNGYTATFVGALCYTFSGYALILCMLRHSFFLIPLVVFPLVLLGAEKLFNGESPVVFCLAVGLSLFVSVYFSYMIFVLLIVYCLGRYFFSEGRKSFVSFVKLFFTFVGFGLVGVLLSGLCSIPNILIISSMGRVSADYAIPIAYQFTFYLNEAANALGSLSSPIGASVYLGPIAIMLLSVFLACRRLIPGNTWKAWSLALLGVFLCANIPFLSHVIHAFSYVTDRWYFALDFVVAYCACLAFPCLEKMRRRERRIAIALCSTVFALSLLSALCREPIAATIAVSSLLFLVILVSFFAATKRSPRISGAVLSVGTIASAALACAIILGPFPYGTNYADEFFGPFGEAYNTFAKDNPYRIVDKNAPEDERANHRYSYPSRPSIGRNESLTEKRNGLSCFYNYNQYIDSFRTELGITEGSAPGTYSGSNSRMALDAFSGARYFVATKNERNRVPATYKKAGKRNGDYTLYRTDYANELGALFETVIPKSEYLKLSMIERQEGLLQSCCLDDAIVQSGDNVVNAQSADLSSTVPTYTIKSAKDAEVKDGTIVASAQDAEIVLRFSGTPDSETYVAFENLDYEPPAKSETPEPQTIKDAIFSLNDSRPTIYTVRMESVLGNTAFRPATRYSSQFSGRVNWAANLGYSKDALNEVRIVFPLAGTYSFDKLSVTCQPIAPIKEKLSSLQKNALTDIKRGHDRITATANLKTDTAYAVFTQAYYSGWTARVDGKKVDVVPADTGFLGVRIEGAGTHEIELEYHTAGVAAGAACSAIGIALLVLISLLRRNMVKPKPKHMK